MKNELVFYGDDILIYDFPDYVDIIRLNKPLKPITNTYSSIKNAILNPIGMPRLEELLNKNSKVVIAFDDVSVPLPLSKYDPRKDMARAVINTLRRIGIHKDNILFICATGLHRKCMPHEIKELIGKEIISKYRVICHDAEKDIITIGETKSGYPIDLNKYAAKADLIIYFKHNFCTDEWWLEICNR